LQTKRIQSSKAATIGKIETIDLEILGARERLLDNKVQMAAAS